MVKEAARKEILARLEAQEPHPGKKHLYQPVPLCPPGEWEVIRADSPRRVAIMTEVLGRESITPEAAAKREEAFSYIDVGCNTGFFCRAMARLGMRSVGVDVVQGDIEVARMIEDHVEKTYSNFISQDAFDYLQTTRNVRLDVTSSMSVLQWVMIQRSLDDGVRCIEWLFQKTRRVCFFEMGYTEEDHYRNKIGVNIDREWTRRIMAERGRFDEILVFESDKHQLKRDFFAGIRRPATPAADGTAR